MADSKIKKNKLMENKNYAQTKMALIFKLQIQIVIN